MEIFNHCFIFWDVETTSNSPLEDDIISIGGVATKFENGQFHMIDEFSQFIFTTRPMDPAAEMVHHISSDMLVGAPEFPNALHAFKNWIIKCQLQCATNRISAPVILIGHNASKFDDLILLCNMIKHRMSIDDFCDTIQCYGFMDSLIMLKALAKEAMDCKMWSLQDLPKVLDTGRVSYALGHCHIRFTGEPIGDLAHDALVDSRALYRIFASSCFLQLIHHDKHKLLGYVVQRDKSLKTLKAQSGLMYQLKMEQTKNRCFDEENEDDKPDDLQDPAWGNIHEPIPKEPILIHSANARHCLNCMTFCLVSDDHRCWVTKRLGD